MDLFKSLLVLFSLFAVAVPRAHASCVSLNGTHQDVDGIRLFVTNGVTNLVAGGMSSIQNAMNQWNNAPCAAQAPVPPYPVFSTSAGEKLVTAARYLRLHSLRYCQQSDPGLHADSSQQQHWQHRWVRLVSAGTGFRCSCARAGALPGPRALELRWAHHVASSILCGRRQGCGYEPGRFSSVS